jgi:hypothetical protein
MFFRLFDPTSRAESVFALAAAAFAALRSRVRALDRRRQMEGGSRFALHRPKSDDEGRKSDVSGYGPVEQHP